MIKKIKTKNKKKKVIVAMSGGIDSSVAAALLKREGHDVIGVFMKFWSEQGKNKPENSCCTLDSEKRARQVAKILQIPFYVFNFEKEFKKRVVDDFLAGHKSGITPNPCVVCNKEIKFGLLLEKALQLNADYVATGHYAQKREQRTQNKKQKIYKLFEGKDKNKDQSYFLWQLDQEQLRRILFPVGDYTKTEVRKLAKKFKLPILSIAESQEICFVPDGINNFLARHLKQNSGKIFNREGEILGEHKGLAFYTIGQRKGINLSGGPYYVMDKDFKKNILIVTSREKDLYKKALTAKSVNWISGKEPKLPLNIKIKIRYRSAFSAAKIYNIQDTPHQSPEQEQALYGAGKHGTGQAIYKIQFDVPQRAVTPGQSAVFYRGKEGIGGGIIRNDPNS